MCFSLAGEATHIVGGVFNLQSIGGNQYVITLEVYRDCENGRAPFNDPLTIGIFDKETNMLVTSIVMSKLSESKINPTLAKCVTQVPGCNEKAIYMKTITLDPLMFNNNDGYYLSWERCCRNHIIQNIISPGDASMAFYAEIPSPRRYINSTPKLAVNPFTVLCIDNLFTYNISFTDADKDSLVYELITPVNGTLDRFNPNDGNQGFILNPGPYRDVTWMPGYNESESIKGNPPLEINYSNGKISVKPSEKGVFAVAFRVAEYRNGVKLGFVNLELQFTVVDCISNTPPVIKLTMKDGANINLVTGNDMYVTIPNNIDFKVNVYDEDELDTVIVQSELANEPPQYIAFTSQQGITTADYNWNWQTYCELHHTPPKKITVTATDRGCPIPKTTQRTFYIKPLPMPVLPPLDILCIELKNNSTSILHIGDSGRTKPYFKQYNLYRADVGNEYKLFDSIPDHFADRYTDGNTPDYNKTDYRYYIRVENICGFEGPSSDTLGTFDQMKYLPDKQYMFNVTVKDNKWVYMQWNKSRELDFARYFLYKGIRGDEPEKFKNIGVFNQKTDTTYLDMEVNVQDVSYCYYLTMLDTCGNVGPQGEVFCTTVLKGKSKPFQNDIEWQPFVATDEGSISYELVKYAPGVEAPLFVGAFVNQLTTTDDKLDYDDGRYEYEAEVLHEPVGWKGVVVRSRSNREPLIQKPLLHVPNAFTPNSDNLNDSWYVSDVFVRDYHLKVFNRWGQLVFETTDKNNKWNAVDLGGNPVPSDVYVYLITYDGWDGLVRNVTGNVSVLK
jgi:gliding motility-associated-like protein